jgi:hypothetical protein
MNSDRPLPHNETLPPRSSLRVIAKHPLTKISFWVALIEGVLMILRALGKA